MNIFVHFNKDMSPNIKYDINIQDVSQWEAHLSFLNKNYYEGNPIHELDLYYELRKHIISTKSTHKIQFDIVSRLFEGGGLHDTKILGNLRQHINVRYNENNTDQTIKYFKNKINTLDIPHLRGGYTKQNEINYQLHSALFVHKLIKGLTYRYILKTRKQIQIQEYIMEMIMNLALFELLQLHEDYRTVFYIDQIACMCAVIIYLRMCDNNEYKVDPNKVLLLTLTPIYALFYE